MAFYLTISEGRSGEEPIPLIATTDPQVIQAVLVALERRIGGRKGRLHAVPAAPPPDRIPR
jgi:hypothetical protein